MCSTRDLTFQVTRNKPELVPPAKPTPYEFKPLSNIDNQDRVRFLVPVIQFYRKNLVMKGKDPVKVLRDAIAKALMFYYPLAGRVREYSDRKLVVECTGEGAVFVEANADVTLQQFGDVLYPPFPCLEELLYGLRDANIGVINSPLLLVQVTRLKCGGFVFGLRLNHTMIDGIGIFQFITAIGEFARGAEAPSVPPVWERHLLNAQTPPPLAHTHQPNTTGFLLRPSDDDGMVHSSFLFRAADISALRNMLPPHLRRCSKFELVTACVWRCRARALSLNPDDKVRFLCLVNFRKRINPPLPEGYYGNAFVYPTVVTTVGELTENPLEYAVELVRKAKSEATEEYVRDVVNSMVVTGPPRPRIKVAESYIASDLTKMGLSEIDYGWGRQAYGGIAEGTINLGTNVLLSFYSPFKDEKNEEGIVAPLCLPFTAMEVFLKELQIILLPAPRSFISNKSAL